MFFKNVATKEISISPRSVKFVTSALVPVIKKRDPKRITGMSMITRKELISRTKREVPDDEEGALDRGFFHFLSMANILSNLSVSA